MVVAVRYGDGGGYRYAFNGMEKDDEVKGQGNSYDFGARMLDSRLGRWLSLDALAAKYPSLSPYNFVANSPMLFVDPDGKTFVFYSRITHENGQKSKVKVVFDGENISMYNKKTNELIGNYITGTDKYIDDFVTSYNYFIDNGADIDNMFQTIANDQNNEIIVRNDASPQGLNTRFDPDKETIFWSPVWGLDIKLDANDPANDEGKAIAGNQSPAIGLFNEVAGAYVSLYFNKEKKRELGIEKLKDEEEWHIDQENKAIDVLNSRGFNETKRFDENCTGCMPRKMTGPTSTQTNKDSTND